jgi:hypothetical protein
VSERERKGERKGRERGGREREGRERGEKESTFVTQRVF